MITFQAIIDEARRQKNILALDFYNLLKKIQVEHDNYRFDLVAYFEDEGSETVVGFGVDTGDHYHSVFAGSHDESLKDLSDTATRNKVVRGIKLTVKKDYNEIQKIVVLDKNNIIQNYDDLNNVKIAKVEYRKIDGLAREFFGVYGSPKTADEVGEIRITLESSEDQELRKVFGQ